MAVTGDYEAPTTPTSTPYPGSQIMPALIFHITQDLQWNHMCTQPFVFMSNEMLSAIIRGWTVVLRGGLMDRRRKERVDKDVKKKKKDGRKETGDQKKDVKGTQARSGESR